MNTSLNKAEQDLCALLKTTLFDRPLNINEYEHIDWESVQHEARTQAVLGLIDSPDRNILAPIIANSMRILHAQNELIKQFEDIQVIILKGTAASIYYPQALRRTMGDVDFLVSQGQFEEMGKRMEENGYVLLPAMTERHRGYEKNGILFELHHHFSYVDLDIEDYLRKGLDAPVYASIGEYLFPMLPALPNGLVLLAHMREHLKSALGLRQVIDWMMYVDKILNDEFWENEFGPVARKKGLDTLAITATRMCQLYLGLSERIRWCRSADQKLCEQLMAMVFTSGNFGRKHREGKEIESVSITIQREGLFRYLQSSGEANWRAYQSHPSLRPLCSLYQLGRILYKGLRTGRGIKIAEDYQRGIEREEFLKRLL